MTCTVVIPTLGRPSLRHLLFERGVVLSGVFQAVVVDEHQLCPASGEAAATSALAGLNQHRMALR